MNILLEGMKESQTHTNVNRDTTTYIPHTAGKAENSGFALDISGTVMDNNAYAGHGRTAEEVMLDAGQLDLTARRNYMAVMSNSMSDEDFARLQKEGFHPGSTEIETVVTIVDHIKAALIKGGTQIAGYTDTISDDALKSIIGSEAYARELKEQFARRDLPLTEENIAAVMQGWEMLTQAGDLTDGGVKYMVENGLKPTPENVYTAKFSAVSDGSRQGKGYYAAGGVSGYYAKKPEEVDLEQLQPQMERVIQEAGYAVDETLLKEAGWLVEKGIPLNAETFSLLMQIRSQSYPVSYGTYAASAACAVADGKAPAKADLNRTKTYMEEADELIQKVNAADERAVDLIVQKDLPLTLKNILAVQDQLKGFSESAESVKERRILAEVRLTMTLEANVRLLRSGYQIETAPLEELVERLKEAEDSYAKALTGEVDKTAAREKASLYQETLKTLQGISTSPAEILTQVSEKDTLKEIGVYGAQRQSIYEKAGQSYEALMTAPRRDMGDSIKKAFRNVDDILKDLDLELNEENRKAVRILGYNSMEITEEQIGKIKEKDEMLCGVIRQMKPGRVLNMIREGINPLNMPLEELEQYLGGEMQDEADQMQSYSKFLYKLEKQKDITEKEKSAYIGIYRLIRQVEKADDAAIGALWQSGMQMTLGNLLRAVRSSKHGTMDYSVDDKFGGIEKRDNGLESITDQIEKAFLSGNLPEGRELLEQVGSKEAEEEFDRMLCEQTRGALKSEETVLSYLEVYGQPVTAETLSAAEGLLKTPGDFWNRLKNLKKKDEINPEKAGREVLDSLNGKEEANEAYQGLKKTIQEILKQTAYETETTSLDVKAMSTLYKQMSFMGSMAREENYEIPVNVNGRLTSINLKLVHNSGKESRAVITFEAEGLGRTAAELKITGEAVGGFCICSTREGQQFLQENQTLLEEKLSKEQLKAGEFYFAKGEKLDLAEYSVKETANRTSGVGAGMLYRAAKAFIGYVQEAGIKKGNTAYEDQF